MRREEFKENAQEIAAELNALPSNVLSQVSGIENMDAASLERAIEGVEARHASEAEDQELFGHASGTTAGLIERGHANTKMMELRKELEEKARKNTTDNIFFLNMLYDLDRLNAELAAVQIEIDTLREALVEEYGEDFMDDMAEMYLSEEELAELEGLSPEKREQAIMDKLADKMLDEDGNLKPEYAGTTIGEYVAANHKKDDLLAEIDETMEHASEHIQSGELDKIEQTTHSKSSFSEAFMEASGHDQSDLVNAEHAVEAQDLEEAPDAADLNALHGMFNNSPV